MARVAKPSGKEQVSLHIKKLDRKFGRTIEYLRQLILSTDPLIAEEIKWNNPSFFYSGEMKPFDPKEYKRDIIVMNLYKNRIMLVFPSGANVKDALLQGDYKDGRRLIEFADLDDVIAKEKKLQRIIKKWLKLVDK